MRAAVYTRVSTDEQAREGLSMDVQERECKELAQRLGYTEIRVYADPGFSGALENRPELDRLLRDAIEGQFDILFTWKFDRLYRVVEYQKRARRELADRGIIWKSATEDIDIYTSSGNLQHSIHATFAEWERDTIYERTRAGKLEKARQGRQIINSRPYGYKIISRAEALSNPDYAGKDGHYVVIPKEIECVKEIYTLCAQGKTLWEISRILTGKSYPTTRGGKWWPSTLQVILKNPVYTGTAYFNRTYRARVRDLESGQMVYRKRERPQEEWIPIPVPAVISQELFDQAQKTLSENRVNAGGRPDRLYPLSGMIKCDVCDFSYQGGTEYYKTQNETRERKFYRPRSPRMPDQGQRCKNKTWKAQDAEGGVLELLGQLAQDPQLIHGALCAYWKEEEQKTEQISDRDRLEGELAKVERQLRTLVEKELDEPDLASIHAGIKAEKMKLRKTVLDEIAKLPPKIEQTAAPKLNDVAAVCEELARRLKDITDPSTLRKVFQLTVDGIKVEENGHLRVSLHIGKLYNPSQSVWDLRCCRPGGTYRY